MTATLPFTTSRNTEQFIQRQVSMPHLRNFLHYLQYVPLNFCQVDISAQFAKGQSCVSRRFLI
jgi:hypothetical protein